MKTQSLLLTLTSGLAAFGLLLLLIRMFGSKLRPHAETEAGLKKSYAAFAGSLLVAGSIMFARALPLISEGFEIQWNQHEQSFVLDAFQFVAALIGFSFVWLVVAYMISKLLLSIILGDRIETIEMERDNLAFFAVRGLALIGLTMMIAPVLENFLRLFMPVLDVPFYR